jgi:hypothetical protein
MAGDSESLVYTNNGHMVVGMLFAGGTRCGSKSWQTLREYRVNEETNGISGNPDKPPQRNFWLPRSAVRFSFAALAQADLEESSELDVDSLMEHR